jgi:hypothetical protein
VELQDTDDMDYLLPQSVTELGNCLFQLLATLVRFALHGLHLAASVACYSSHDMSQDLRLE